MTRQASPTMLNRLFALLGRNRQSQAPASPHSASTTSAPPHNNPIQKLLSDAGVPWQSSRQALVERFGVSTHPALEIDIIKIETPEPFLKNLLWPLSAHVLPQFSQHLPATYFSTVTSYGENSRDNLRLTAQQLIPLLGPARIAERTNTVQCEWLSGAASLRLIVWPLDLQDGTRHENSAHVREPRTATGCHVEIETGFRLAVADEERDWLNNFVPAGPITFVSAPASEYELEYVREPIAGIENIRGRVGTSANRDALIFWQSQLYVVPMADVIGLTVDRMTPAKGSGGSWLKVECRTQCEGLTSKSLFITRAAGADDLNTFGAELASATGKPLTLSEYCADC